MAPDAAADVLADLPKRTFDEVLEEMPGQEAREVRELLEFDASTAGGMMNPDFAFVGEATTRDELLQWMREQDLNLDQLDSVVLLDNAAQFAGTVAVSRLLLAASDQSLAELRMEPLLNLEASADDDEVFELFDKYNLRTVTVVDEGKHPIGVITVDDVVSRLVKSR
jgi:magnesium transporter